jgi:two-component system, NtrC family, response regulator HydG
MPRILVVDDEPALRLTLAGNLDLAGFEVSTAPGGEQALEQLKREGFDLVLTDFRMPGMTGAELFRAIRALGLTVPVVLMTACHDPRLIPALETGAFTLLEKPFDMKSAVRTLKLALSHPMVLVVDDNEPTGRVLAEGLQLHGIDALYVTGAAEAMRVLPSSNVDVCVVDMYMPEMNGAELVEQLSGLKPDTSVIAMSGHRLPEMLGRVAARGMHAFLNKPVRLPELMRSIATARAHAVQGRTA